jgi:hypothetical protein
LFNALIRIKGRQLAKRILSDNAEYVRSLKQLDEWQKGLHEQYESWSEWARRIMEDSSLGLDEKVEQVQAYLTDKRKQVRDSYATIQTEFRPYCQTMVDRMIEGLGQQLETTLGVSKTVRRIVPLPIFQQ